MHKKNGLIACDIEYIYHPLSWADTPLKGRGGLVAAAEDVGPHPLRVGAVSWRRQNAFDRTPKGSGRSRGGGGKRPDFEPFTPL